MYIYIHTYTRRYRESQPRLAEHTHAGAGSRRLALALSGAPVCGSEKLPEGSRRDTGGVSVTYSGGEGLSE